MAGRSQRIMATANRMAVEMSAIRARWVRRTVLRGRQRAVTGAGWRLGWSIGYWLLNRWWWKRFDAGFCESHVSEARRGAPASDASSGAGDVDGGGDVGEDAVGVEAFQFCFGFQADAVAQNGWNSAFYVVGDDVAAVFESCYGLRILASR